MNNDEIFIDIYLLEPNSIEIRKLNEKKIQIPYELYSTSKILKPNRLPESFILFNLLNNPNIQIVLSEAKYIVISFDSEPIYVTSIKLNDYKRLLNQDFRSSINYEKILNFICEINSSIEKEIESNENNLKYIEKEIKKLKTNKNSLLKNLNNEEKLYVELNKI